jgi:non-ribosomal peptide synthetase-like protein
MNDMIRNATRPDAATTGMSILRGPERPDLLKDEVLADILLATCQAHAGHRALICGEQVLTYAQLEAETNRLAKGLIEAGVGPGDVVGLWMPRGADLLIAQIAITKSGAAWLPFDADAPIERIAICLDDCDAKGLLSNEAFRARAQAHGGITRTIWADTMLGARDESSHVDPRQRGLTPDHPAYMIYTSGSTGTPKGIVISHRNICHFLRSANEIYGVKSNDVVFQGSSVAFDLSMEEIWIPYLVGATLVVATPEIMGDAEKLPDVMIEAGITVIDTVPTLLSLLPRDIPSVRIILLGGEALPAPLISKWAKAGRQIFNTYGPTEATVVATVSEVQPGQPVTIGKPIANYTAYICDENLQPVAAGVQGELVIGGPGVAQGYLRRPDLTAEKFVANPFSKTFGDTSGDPILYRSGDAVSLDANGDILFHGRIDDQVKIRGFRVELGEIETRLAYQPGVAQASVVMRNDDGMDRLVAFLVPAKAGSIDVKALRSALREALPAYMVPAHFEAVTTLPRLSSGKVDRNSLRVAALSAPVIAETQDEPQTRTEAVLLDAAKRVFGNLALPLEADFFTELGGHSLIAARFISVVRETPALMSITLQDVYGARTLRAIAAGLDARLPAGGADMPPPDLSFTPPPLLRRFLCGLAQLAALPIIISLHTAQWLGVFLTYLLISGDQFGFFTQMGLLLGVYMLINIMTKLIALAAKWIIIGRTKPGRYPLWGVYYYRWWLARSFLTLMQAKWFQGSPLMRYYLIALGARVGKETVISEFEAGAIDLVSIGGGATIGSKVKFANAEAVGNEFVIGPITIGADAYIGTSAVISHDVVIEDHAELLDLTALPEYTHVGKAEKWDGSPGRKVGMVDVASLPVAATASRRRRSLVTMLHVLMLLTIPPISLLPIFPAFYLWDQIDDHISEYTEISYFWYLPVLTWPTAIALVMFTVGLIAALRWAILPRVRSGTHSIYSGFYMRKWTVSLATDVTLDTLTSLFATIYMRNWYRLMGANIGRGAEISTNLAGRYDITSIGAGNFIADEVIMGDEDVRRGWMTLETVKTGDRVFVGNDAVVPPGSIIPDGVLIGIKSKPPANELMKENDTWFGSPPIKLPTRQKFDGVAANWTYQPSFGRKLWRAVFEALHTSFPAMLFIMFGTLSVAFLFEPAIAQRAWGQLVLSFVAASIGIALVQTVICAAMKWIMMGVYKPVMKPMWSWWAMRTEAIAVLYWGLGGKVLLEHIRGTPFLPWILRLFGVKTGKGVWMDSTDITEFDCVTIGDFCTINAQSALQTHLYEDRVMKVGRVHLGKGVCVGAGATVLYDTHIGDYAQLRPLTVVMKGENIPANTQWEGAPAVPSSFIVQDKATAKAAA